MNPHPQIRKAVKWGGAVLTVLLVAVWIGSGWTRFEWQSARVQCTIDRGLLSVSTDQFLLDELLRTTFESQLDFNWRRFRWHFRWEHNPAGSRLTIPLWSVALAAAAVSLSAWCLDILARRRAVKGECPKCNYDRTDLAPGAVCPECGAVPLSV